MNMINMYDVSIEDKAINIIVIFIKIIFICTKTEIFTSTNK